VTPGELDGLLAASAGADVPPLDVLLARLARPDTDEITRSAVGPLAPLVCRAMVNQTGPVPDPWVSALLTGLAGQSNLLALLEATDALLAASAFLGRHGTRLHATFLRGHAATLGHRPLIAAAFAEAALRLAIVDIGNVPATVAMLSPDDVTVLDPDYTERLPRLVGAALDTWGADRSAGTALRQTLVGLQDVPDASTDATVEHGLDLLRQAVADPVNVRARLVVARQQFANAEAAEEGRHDAALYGAGIDAVMGFFRESSDDLSRAQTGIRAGLARRAAMLRNSHVPEWRRPREIATRAWDRLAGILGDALSTVGRTSWPIAWTALDAVLDAYVLDRSLIPVPGVPGPDGLARLVRPIIETSIVERQVLLVQLRDATDEAGKAAAEPYARIGQLRRLRERLDQLARPDTHQTLPADPGVVVRERLIGIAPTLIAELGMTAAAHVAAGLDDEGLRLVEGVTYNAAVSRAATRDPVMARMLQQLTTDLLGCPDYTGEVRQAFDSVLEATVTFLATRHDLQRSADIDYLTLTRPPPREARLQDDYANWLRQGPLAGRIGVEIPNVATGRADVQISFGTTKFYVEVKREQSDASKRALERSYLTQAADYSGTSAALGLMLVLDLTPHPSGVRHLSDCAWVTRYRPTNSDVDRYVVVAVVIGNRGTPSTYSATAR
jgi:hypothetical protein